MVTMTPAPTVYPWIPDPYTLPALPKASDNGLTLLAIIAPALFLPCFIGGVIQWLDSVFWFRATDAQKGMQIFFYWIFLLFVMLAAGFKTVHTSREAVVADYKNVVDLWEHSGGQSTFQKWTSFDLAAQSYSGGRATARRQLTPMSVPITVHNQQDNEGIVQATSVYFETNFTASQYENGGFNYLYSNVGGVSRSAWISSYTFNQSRSLYVSCYKEYCTDGNCGKKFSSSGSCSITPGSPIRQMCDNMGGIWTRTSRYTTYCKAYSSCGTCRYQQYLDSVCFWVKRTSTGMQLSSDFSGCDYPYASQTYRLAINGYKPRKNITVQVRSTNDPALRLSRLTSGSDTLGISSFDKYGKKGNVFIAVAVIFGIIAFTITCRIEGYLCFNQSLSYRMQQFMAQRNNVPNTDNSAAAAAGATPTESSRLVNQSGGGDGATSGSQTSEQERAIACQICLDAARDRRFQPCGHHLTCEPCGKLFIGKNCPLCRQKVRAMEFCAPNLPTFPRFTPSASS